MFVRNSWEHALRTMWWVLRFYPPDEAVVYVAHWDHLGIGQPVDGDSIYNGASDNAAAMAWVLAIAEEFKVQPQTERSLLFFIPTAEESSLLGSYHYVENPVFPMEKTVAGFNSDVILMLGRFEDVTVTGLGHSELDQYLETEAIKQGRYIANDPNPENGMFFRSDQLPFMKKGVPFLFAKGYTHQRELGKRQPFKSLPIIGRIFIINPVMNLYPNATNWMACSKMHNSFSVSATVLPMNKPILNGIKIRNFIKSGVRKRK